LLFSICANAQITITPYLQGDITHYANFPDKNFEESALFFRHQSDLIIAYNTGLYLNYTINEKWDLKSGITIQKMGDKTIYNVDDFPIIDDEISSTFHHNFISIPLQAEYKLKSNKRYSPYIAFGTNLYWNTSSIDNRVNYNNNGSTFITEESIGNTNRFNFSLKTDFGVRYELTEKLNLNTFLSGNILTLSTFNSDIFGRHHYNVGLGIGLDYKI